MCRFGHPGFSEVSFMPAASNPPDADQVRRFLLGLLGDPEHQRIEQLLAESSDWLAVAESTATKDALLETLQAVGNTTEPHLPASVTELIARLERICPATAAAETVAPLATLAPGAPATVTAPPSSYPFLDPPDQPSYLGRLGGCRIVKELGKGGMGIVFLAEDLALNRRVAIKVMRPDIAAHPKARQRFLREAQAAAALEHEHVVPIYQVGEAGGAAAVPGRYRLPRCSALAARPPRDWPPPTPSASSTATSSPIIYGCTIRPTPTLQRRAARSRFSTSAWPAPWRPATSS
jgi:hypothetical protein